MTTATGTPGTATPPGPIDKFKAWWNDPRVSKEERFWTIFMVFAALLLLVMLCWWLFSGTSRQAREVSVNGSVTQDFIARYNDEQKLVTGNLEQLKIGLNEVRTNLEKQKARSDKLAQDTQQLQESLKVDPKSVELQQQNIERLKKLQAIPLVPLTPLTPTLAPADTKKTS